MSQVSIVGVDGSGKTVLMAALGERYETADEYGFFLSADTAQTFNTVKMLMDRMRHGMWPNATTLDTVRNLNWTLFRKQGRQNVSVAALSFLDYAGEIYRLGFGEHSNEETSTYTEQIETLREHIKASGALIVLINLKDIISGDLSDPKTREMLWISKSIIDFALTTAKVPNVALAFTQYEVYRDEIEAAGGLEGAYRKYLRHVANLYPDLKLFAVSAVDKTEIDEATGYEIPARDFSSQGLEELMEWIISKTPGHERDIADVKELPGQLWTSLKGEAGLVLNETGGTLSSRLEHAKKACEILLQLEGLDPKRLNAVASSDELHQIRTKVEDFQKRGEKAEAVLKDLLAAQEEKSPGELQAWIASQGVDPDLTEGLIKEVADAYRVRQNKREEARNLRKGLLVAASLALAFCALIGGLKGWESYQKGIAEEIARKVSVGYTPSLNNGKRVVKWVRGVRVPKNDNLETDSREGTYLAVRPGFTWVPGTLIDKWTPGYRWDPMSDDIVAGTQEGTWVSTRPGYVVSKEGSTKTLVWTPGLKHPNNSLLKAATEKDKWVCAKPGYKWMGGDRVVWCPGVKHPTDPHLISSQKEGSWESDTPGYVWDGGDKAIWKPGLPLEGHAEIHSGEKEGEWVTDKPGYIVDADFNLVWKPGLTHPDNARLVSDAIEGQWMANEAGYEWDGGSQTKWVPGIKNPFNSKLKSSTIPDEWVATAPGYVWVGGSRTEWKSGLTHPDNSNLISTSTEGEWKSTRAGYVWSGGSSERWDVGSTNPNHPHVIAGDKPDKWYPETGYKWVNPQDNNDFSVVWEQGLVDEKNHRKTSSIEGQWVKQIDCSVCNGSGQKGGLVTCTNCGGDGTVGGSGQCSTCNGHGQVTGTSSCSQCGGKGSAMFKCEQMAHNMSCFACRGKGQVNLGFGFMPCGGCQGTGRMPCYVCGNRGVSLQTCNRCSGTGQVRSIVQCPTCSGGGRVATNVTCSQCHGTGRVSGKVNCTNCGRNGCPKGKVWEDERVHSAETIQEDTTQRKWVPGHYEERTMSDGTILREWVPGRFE